MSTLTDKKKNELLEILPRLRRFSHSLTCDPNAGDDLAQATVERALSRIETWDETRPLQFWVFKIAKNLWYDQLRAQKVRGHTENIDDLPDVIEDKHQADMETSQLLKEVREKMRELPQDQHIVLVLVAIEGYSYKEAAAMLDLPIGTVMSRLSRARTTLVKIFGNKL